MKLREETIEYDVRSHGKEYKNPENVWVCPECYSTNTHRIKNDSSSNYICDDCDCVFMPHKMNNLTPTGNLVCTVLRVVQVIFIILAILSFIIGIVWGSGKDFETMTDVSLGTIVLIVFVCLGLPAIFGILAFCVSEVIDDI